MKKYDYEFIKKIAKKIHRVYPLLELNEFISIGYLGFARAFENYDESKNDNFYAYAYIKVWGWIMDHVRYEAIRLKRFKSEPSVGFWSQKMISNNYFLGGIKKEENNYILNLYENTNTLKDIAEKMKLTESRVSQKFVKIKKRLRLNEKIINLI